MRIAQVAPLFESVPPRLYGGTERVVSYLTDELVRMGHEVTLFASGDSSTSARLVPCCEQALRLCGLSYDQTLTYETMLLEQVFKRASEFDLIHFHTNYVHFPLSRRHRVPVVHTLHGRLDTPELVPLFREFRDIPLVSISNAQRAPLPFANWRATVYHGLPADLYRFHARPQDYLLFLGRLSPEKRVDQAIGIAARMGLPLKIAAKIDRADADYYREVRPLLARPGVEFVGEVGGEEKERLLGEARALLFPIDWPEPFGLVMIEAFACGTPVIAYRRGSVPEVVEHGVTGYVVDDVDGAPAALEKLDEIDRRVCRARYEARFTSRRMAQDYLRVYREMVSEERIVKHYA